MTSAQSVLIQTEEGVGKPAPIVEDHSENPVDAPKLSDTTTHKIRTESDYTLEIPGHGDVRYKVIQRYPYFRPGIRDEGFKRAGYILVVVPNYRESDSTEPDRERLIYRKRFIEALDSTMIFDPKEREQMVFYFLDKQIE